MEENIFSRRYFLIPGECNAQSEMPLTLLISRIIEIATAHADTLGIGYASMNSNNLGWVLSRLTIEMSKFPKVHSNYEIKTWIESWNRHFSERCFEISTKQDGVLGYVRTIWMVINTKTHANAGTSSLDFNQHLISERECPIAGQSKHRPIQNPSTAEYVFRYTDIDFYRHVNTVRYVDLLMNQFTMERLDTSDITRFEIAFMHEAHYGEGAKIHREDTGNSTSFEIAVDENRILSARFIFAPKRRHNTSTGFSE